MFPIVVHVVEWTASQPLVHWFRLWTPSWPSSEWISVGGESSLTDSKNWPKCCQGCRKYLKVINCNVSPLCTCNC